MRSSTLPASPSVGASLLAKNANDNACFLNIRGVCEFFASKLAPTQAVTTMRSDPLLLLICF
ncbi:hypothetical protein B4O85_29225 [Pseudomonas azotoformans]|uniref:Uncharacterized protein n=1 Tax=Pseudomonas azotoformans TaxID=47878 RepID=A0A4Q0HC57_PSEAZ|nr:hypothetical protein B4O85_29225 [Pseudomonas azotoformans]